MVGSEFVQKYLGEGPRMVRDVFRLAKENAPAIIFIDEIDAIATKRFDAQTGGTNTRGSHVDSVYANRTSNMPVWHFPPKFSFKNLLLFRFCRILSVKHLVSFISSAADREVQRILLELLNQMDGFDQNVNVKVSSVRLSEEALNIPPVTAPSLPEYCRATTCPAFTVSNVNLLSLSGHRQGLSYPILPRKHMFSPTNDPWHLTRFVDRSY